MSSCDVTPLGRPVIPSCEGVRTLLQAAAFPFSKESPRRLCCGEKRFFFHGDAPWQKNHSADREEWKPTCSAAERESPTRGGARALLSWHSTGTRWCTGTAMHEWQHLDVGTERAAPSTGHPASICSSPPPPLHNLQQVLRFMARVILMAFVNLLSKDELNDDF